jgi:site-specific recombinase
MRRLDKLVDMTACISRSQFAAALGNVFFVIPTALAFDAVWKLVTKHHFLAEDKAHHVVESLHLIASGTILYAAYTGVLLWASSIVAGWLENWAVYHRLPDALAHHRQLGFIFGRERMQRFSRSFAAAISGIAGNTALGIFLGMTAPVASFFGLPLDVRHVTLSTGSLTLAGATLGWRACVHAQFIFAVLGVVGIGIMNFGVSFVCALFIALRARDLHGNDLRVLLRTFFSRLRKSTASFWFPPKDAAVADVEAPESAVAAAKEDMARQAAAPDK